jgi:hypothetical protein
MEVVAVYQLEPEPQRLRAGEVQAAVGGRDAGVSGRLQESPIRFSRKKVL